MRAGVQAAKAGQIDLSVVDPQHPFLLARPRRAGFLMAK
jgi:hypothetical protein